MKLTEHTWRWDPSDGAYRCSGCGMLGSPRFCELPMEGCRCGADGGDGRGLADMASEAHARLCSDSMSDGLDDEQKELVAYFQGWELSSAAEVLRMYENDELFRQCDVDADVQIALSEVLPMDKSGRLVRPGDMMVVDGVPTQAMAVGEDFFMSKTSDGEWRSFDSQSHLHSLESAVGRILERCRDAGRDDEHGKCTMPTEYFVDEIMELFEGQR